MTSFCIACKGNLRLPGDVPGMATRIVEIIFQVIKSISVFPFFFGFRCFVIPQVTSRINLCSEELAPLTSPDPELHLIMSIV